MMYSRIFRNFIQKNGMMLTYLIFIILMIIFQSYKLSMKFDEYEYISEVYVNFTMSRYNHTFSDNNHLKLSNFATLDVFNITRIESVKETQPIDPIIVSNVSRIPLTYTSVKSSMNTIKQQIKNVYNNKKYCQYDFKVYVYEIPQSLPSVYISEEARHNNTLHVCQKCNAFIKSLMFLHAIL